LNISVINGSGTVGEYKLNKGDHFIIPYGFGNYHLQGNMEMIISHI
jgi:mannose-6-phosphate isomerase class I